MSEQEKVFVTPPCELSFPHLYHKAPTSKSNKDDKDKWQYSASLLYVPGTPGWEEIEAEVDALKKKLGRRMTNCCLLRPDEQRKIHEGYEGKTVLRMKNKKRPGIYGTEKDAMNNWVPIAEDEDRVYGGAICRAVVSFWTYDNDSVGVGCNVKNVQILGSGTRYGGGTPSDPNEDFQEDEAVEEFAAQASSMFD